ncbi:unnamed protein product [Linum tenue]|uniref:PGG domain-containing protein n=1 Tax=Linum tenue TaxID=586396 RepID=A0AAV0RLD5_9ROSI|nr:unnamed protein product [Linum tenue]
MATTHFIIPTRVLLQAVGDIKSYDNWLACLKTYLLSQDLWDLIDSPVNTSPASASAAAAEDAAAAAAVVPPAWRRKNAAALHAIQVSLGCDLLHEIREIDSAKEAWDALADMHRKKLKNEPRDGAEQQQQADAAVIHINRLLDPSPPPSPSDSFAMTMSPSSSSSDAGDINNNNNDVITNIATCDLHKLTSTKSKESFGHRSSADDAAAGEKWMKETATSSTVVGSLIITIMFTAACTVPGGNNQEKGTPILLHDRSFKIFIASDALSLFAASTSVLMFLGILTSRYAEADFRRSLPTKLVIGLSTLFVSIAAMMVTFCATVMIVMDHRPLFVVPIVMMAAVPVTLFLLLQFPLLVQIFRSNRSGPHSNPFDRKMKPWLLSL